MSGNVRLCTTFNRDPADRACHSWYVTIYDRSRRIYYVMMRASVFFSVSSKSRDICSSTSERVQTEPQSLSRLHPNKRYDTKSATVGLSFRVKRRRSCCYCAYRPCQNFGLSLDSVRRGNTRLYRRRTDGTRVYVVHVTPTSLTRAITFDFVNSVLQILSRINLFSYGSRQMWWSPLRSGRRQI